MATATATQPRRRGRPKNSESKVVEKGHSGGLIEPVREGLRQIVGVCQTCGHTIRPIQPVAEEIGVSPVVLAKFIKGDAGVSMLTFDALYGYVQEHQNEAAATPTEASAEAVAEG